MFIEIVLKQEQEEYRNEGVEWIHITYANNEEICRMIDVHPKVTQSVHACRGEWYNKLLKELPVCVFTFIFQILAKNSLTHSLTHS